MHGYIIIDNIDCMYSQFGLLILCMAYCNFSFRIEVQDFIFIVKNTVHTCINYHETGRLLHVLTIWSKMYE